MITAGLAWSNMPSRAHLPARNGLVNEVEFLGLIPESGNGIARSVINM